MDVSNELPKQRSLLFQLDASTWNLFSFLFQRPFLRHIAYETKFNSLSLFFFLPTHNFLAVNITNNTGDIV